MDVFDISSQILYVIHGMGTGTGTAQSEEWMFDNINNVTVRMTRQFTGHIDAQSENSERKHKQKWNILIFLCGDLYLMIGYIIRKQNSQRAQQKKKQKEKIWGKKQKRKIDLKSENSVTIGWNTICVNSIETNKTMKLKNTIS